MDTFSNDLLSVVDRLSARLGPVTALIDGIVDRIAPKMAAQAVCPPPSCDSYCFSTCAQVSNCNPYPTLGSRTNYYSCSAFGCANNMYFGCTVAGCSHC